MTMEPPTPSSFGHSNPLLSLSTLIHQHCLRLGAEIASRFEEAKRLAGSLAVANFPLSSSKRCVAPSLLPPFAVLAQPTHALAATVSYDQVAKSLIGTSVYTISNDNNEFVLISDSDGAKSIGLLCFRREDAEAFLAQVRLRRRELRKKARVVPITLDQVYMLKAEGIAFRFLPDPVQIKNALELKTSDIKGAFDGVPVFQSDLLVIKKKNKRYCPVYFSKEDIEKELWKVSKSSRGTGILQHIMVGSLENVLRKMEISDKNSGWEDLIFIPPGKGYTEHLQEIAEA